MSLWLTDVLAPETLYRHVALFLVIVALVMPSLALVRWMALVAGLAGALLATFVAHDAIDFFWWGLLVVVTVVRILFGVSRRPGRALTEEERMFRDRAVPTLSPGQVRRLLDVGRWREVMAGTTLVRAGESARELAFVVRGQVDIVVDGHKVAECGPGSLVGEIGMSTGEPATATAVCATPVRYLSFEAARLYRLLDSHADLQDAVELAIDKSLREKLHRSNLIAAHAGDHPPR
jgi:hypothetical protein